jgi:uncharacterized protein (TIGR02271 family)
MQHLNLTRDHDIQFPESMADVRGFEVRTQSDDEKVGTVDSLICSPDGQIRYLDVNAGGFFTSHRVALPVGAAQVDRANDVVWIRGMTKDQVKDLPEYTGRPDTLTDEYESRIQQSFRGGDATIRSSDADLYDQGRFYAERGGPEAGDARLVLAEEQLNVGKRQVQAGEVGLRKRVETEHVEEQVQLAREEVTVERRPITDRNASVNAEIKEEEIRIPLMAEEAIVEKRTVPVEEVVVKKHQVSETQTVGADVQRERLDESGLRGSRASNLADQDVSDDINATGSTKRRKGRGVADKVADAVDNVKDRVDGNPASRPGPDATDRRF